MNVIKCSYPGCLRMFTGKGLFCDIHGPKPGTISKLSGTDVGGVASCEGDGIGWSDSGTPITVGGDGCEATGTPITVGGEGQE